MADYHFSGTTLSIAEELGCTVYQWTVDGHDLLFSPPDYTLGRHAWEGGNALLFPAVGRTWDTSQRPAVADRYHIAAQSTSYVMPIHGILELGRWTSTDTCRDSERLALSFEFQPTDTVLQNHYPYDVRFMVRYTVTESTLQISATIHNQGVRPAPVAYGLHPYFQVANRAMTTLDLPCQSQLLLDPDLLIPNGEAALNSSLLTIQANRSYDDVFVAAPKQSLRATLVNSGANRQIHIDADWAEAFVIYSPAETNFVCVEPWTRGIGGFSDLREPGWEQRGRIRVLGSDEIAEFQTCYTVETIP